MIRSDDDPATKTVAEVDDASTADEADDVGQRCPERQDEDLKMGRPHSAQSTMTKKNPTVASSVGGLDLRCTSWSSPCSGWPRSTPAWFLFRGRCCRCRSWWRPNGSRRSRSKGRRRGRRGGRWGRRLPCSRSLFSGWSRWCSACRWRWWGCTSRSQTPACRTRARLSRCCSCSTGCTPGYGTRSVSWVLPPLGNLSAEFEAAARPLPPFLLLRTWSYCRCSHVCFLFLSSQSHYY